MTPPVISISTAYPGASSDVIESRVTTVIEDQISGIEGVKAMRSSSTDGSSRINLEFDLDRDIDAAANDVRDRVSRAVRRLPEDVRPPEVRKQDSDARPAMYINVRSSVLNRMELTDYTERYIADRFRGDPRRRQCRRIRGPPGDADLGGPAGPRGPEPHGHRHRVGIAPREPGTPGGPP